MTTGGSSGSGGSGEAGAAGEGVGGTAGEAGGGTIGDPTVRGHVMDLWRMPVPNAPVGIGDVTTTTDVDGNFVIENVPPEYDASVIVQLNYRSYGWVYQGLTRRDPTLQVYEGLRDAGGAEFQVSHQNASFGTDSTWLLALGSEGGSWTEDQGDDATRDIWGYWVGPNTMSWGVHGLLFRTAAGIPLGYDAYDTVTESVTDQDTRAVTFDFQATALTTGTVGGTVTSPVSTQRVNRLFLRFASGAGMPVVREDTPGSGAYSYLLPDLPDSSITVAASHGPVDGPYALAYRDGALPGDTGMDLEIPQAAATVVSPGANATNVTDTTNFLFTKIDSGVGAFVVVIGGQYSETGLYIVTSKAQFTLSEFPVVAGAFSLASESDYAWWVESHGRPASVDAMAGPDGGLDSFGFLYTEPIGPSRGEGAYTSSNTRTLRTAP